MRPLITLTSDFGLRDAYVAMMKGVIVSRCPQATIIDISHTISPQDIAGAGRLLRSAAPYFPSGTVHVAVVDPGVGTRRRIICLAASRQLFVAPDNGLLTPFLPEAEAAFTITNSDLYQHPVSTTFHGRDIMAPVAAALANGLPPHEVGPGLELAKLQRLKPIKPVIHDGTLHGQCVATDHFGNILTNISRQDLENLLGPDLAGTVSIGPITIKHLSHTYGSESGRLIALINSNDELEIAVVQGNASDQLNVIPGTQLTVQRQK